MNEAYFFFLDEDFFFMVFFLAAIVSLTPPSGEISAGSYEPTPAHV